MAALIRVAAVVLGLLLAGPAAAGGPLSPTASLQPSRALFADRIAAVATVVVDRAAIDPADVRAVAAFGPLDTLSGPVVERSNRGGLTVVRFRWEVACLSQECVPSAAAQPVAMPPLRVTAQRRGGGRVGSVVRWPALSIVGRATARDVAAATPPFRLETQLPPPSYRAAPATLATVLDAVAVASVLAVLLLATREISHRRRRREEERLALLSPLERALVLLREAVQRGPGDRRRALNLLARVLGGPGSRLGGAASELAWSPPEPSPEQIESVVGEVERTVGQR